MKKMTRFAALLTAAALFMGTLTGCGLGSDETDVAETDTPAGEEATATPAPTSALTVTETPDDGKLTVLYSAGATLNPYTTTSSDNLAVTGLIYEGLYALEENFTASAVLCQNLNTVDGLHYTLELKSGVSFHEGGGLLTVEDVVYSMELAKDSDVYGGRLSVISSFQQAVDADGEEIPDTIDIVLTKTHGNLPVLLTFPIIAKDTGDWTYPPGTGPYAYSQDAGVARLERFSGYWGGEAPIDTIYLTEVTTMEQLTADFNSGILDIVGLDLTSTGLPNFSGNREPRTYETTYMDYIGFNIWSGETSREEVRQAISYAIDRAYITDNIMTVSDVSMGVASALPLHPSLSYYDSELAAQYAYDLDKAKAILNGEVTLDKPDLTAEDEDEDSGDPEADAPEEDEPEASPDPEPDEDTGDESPGEEGDDDDEDDEEPAIELTLLVCSDNTTRMESAVYVAQCVAALGYKVNIREESYEDYVAALEKGDFDLYYAQVRLQPDFDLTELLVGDLAYAGANTLVDAQVINDFLAAGQADRADRARDMCEVVLTEAPIAVIGFRHLAVVTQKGVVTGMRPTQENIYYGVTEWSVNIGDSGDSGDSAEEE